MLTHQSMCRAIRHARLLVHVGEHAVGEHVHQASLDLVNLGGTTHQENALDITGSETERIQQSLHTLDRLGDQWLDRVIKGRQSQVVHGVIVVVITIIFLIIICIQRFHFREVNFHHNFLILLIVLTLFLSICRAVNQVSLLLFTSSTQSQCPSIVSSRVCKTIQDRYIVILHVLNHALHEIAINLVTAQHFVSVRPNHSELVTSRALNATHIERASTEVVDKELLSFPNVLLVGQAPGKSRSRGLVNELGDLQSSQRSRLLDRLESLHCVVSGNRHKRKLRLNWLHHQICRLLYCLE